MNAQQLRERNREYQRRYRAKVGNKNQLAYRQRHPDRVRSFRLMKEYGITHAEYEAMLAAQGGLCAICRQTETYRLPDSSVSPLVIDHNHATGKVRALLCRACNSAIGLFGEDEHRLAAALDYLREHR